MVGDHMRIPAVVCFLLFLTKILYLGLSAFSPSPERPEAAIRIGRAPPLAPTDCLLGNYGVDP